jgi:hypothetical protein
MHSYVCHLSDNGHVQADGNMTNGDEVDDDNNQMLNEGDFMNYQFGFAFNWPLLALSWIHALSISTISTSVQMYN